MINLFDELQADILQENDLRKKHPETYHPSAAGDCIRKLFYKYKGIQESEPIPANNLIKMDVGTGIHASFQKRILRQLAQKNIPAFTEVEFFADLGLCRPLHGYIDFAWKENDQWIGAELKTMYGFAIQDARRNGPKPEHIIQSIIYASQTLKIGEYENVRFNSFQIYYYSRDNGDCIKFTLDIRNDNGVDVWCIDGTPFGMDYAAIIGKFRLLDDMLKDDDIPERPYNVAIRNGEIVSRFQRDKKELKSDWQCLYCQWRSHCWDEFLKPDSIGLYKDKGLKNTMEP